MHSTGDAAISPGFQRVVRHCLEKDPSRRFQSAKDLAFALENIDVRSSIIQPAAPFGAASAASEMATHKPRKSSFRNHFSK
jgi:serine/threonine protein kinase